MEWCLNIDTDKFKIRKLTNYNYKFLDILKNRNIDINVYYDILNSYEPYKLKNLYNFIYKRILKLNVDNMIYIPTIQYISPEYIDGLLYEYSDSEMKSIIIINSIQQYFQPLIHI
jgi:hypothetical protein